MISELARRGLAHPNTAAFIKRAVTVQRPEGSRTPEHVEVPIWGGILIAVSFWVSVIAIYLVSYMLHEVIATLSMVESPAAIITVSPSTAEHGDKEEKEGLLATGPTITLVNQKPITSSIRGTIRHLVAQAGRGARFRGVRIYFVYATLFSFVSSFLSVALPRIPGQPLFVAGLTGAALANLHATWTHKVVSMPTEKSFCARFRAASQQWKTLALPAAIEATMPYVSLYLACGVSMLLGLHKLDQENIANYSSGQAACLLLRVVAAFVFLVACTLFLCLPAIVTLIRIEASVLPEDQDTIVPFDRSFDGKVVSQLMGGTGKVGFLDAWRSFNWEARRRLIKLFVKSTLIIFGLMFIIAHVLVAEMFVVMGPQLGQLLSQLKAQVPQ